MSARPWPKVRQYEVALLEGGPNLAEPLRQLTPRRRAGLNRSIGFKEGKFGAVCRLDGDDRTVALKVFKRSTPNIESHRYAEIRDYLKSRDQIRSLVDLEFYEEGIYVDRAWWPALAMEWCRGEQLDNFLDARLVGTTRSHVDTGSLCAAWLDVVDELRQYRIAHGDLQHGNVFIDATDGTMMLVDYDGMYVPTMPRRRATLDQGHPSYQHPYRRAGGRGDLRVPLDEHLDCFSALVMLVNLSALSVEAWERYDGDRLLIDAEDLKNPVTADYLGELRKARPPTPELVDLLVRADLDLGSADPLLCEAARMFGKELAQLPEVAPEPQPEPGGPGETTTVVPPPPVERTNDDLADEILGLTPRQRAYVRCALANRDPDWIAQHLGVKPATCSSQTRRVLRQLELDDDSLEDARQVLQFGELNRPQRETVRRLARGQTPATIAAELKRQPRTIAGHIGTSKRRLLAKDDELVDAALEADVIDEKDLREPPKKQRKRSGAKSTPSARRPKQKRATPPGARRTPEAPGAEPAARQTGSHTVARTLGSALATLLAWVAIAGVIAGFLDIVGVETFVTRSLPGGAGTAIGLGVASFAIVGIIGVLIEDDD